MHPILGAIKAELDKSQDDPELRYRFALDCVEDVSGNLEDEAAIDAYERFKALVARFDDHSPRALEELASELKTISQSHPGSKSIDGARHAAVSATYALARAVDGDAVNAAAYAAYSSVYGYGGYAVNDPDSFAEAHQRQLDVLLKRRAAQTAR
ncbi:MAG: hypothetical protein KDJ30_15340 [Rhodoblastus sp.]|nr:hypothetical protein [Rhodoblastus sp.]